MKTITIKIESDRDAELLKKILKDTPFEDKVELEEEGMEDEEFRMYEDRMEEYKRNPASGIALDELQKELKEKYGL
jgi:hypothetical protein